MKSLKPEDWILMFSLLCGAVYIYIVFAVLPERFLWLVLALVGLMSGWNSVDLYFSENRNQRQFVISVIAALLLLAGGLLLLLAAPLPEGYLSLASYSSLIVFVYSLDRLLNRVRELWIK